MPTIAELLAAKGRAAVSAVLPSSGVVMPVAGASRVSGDVARGHRAIDFGARPGTPVVASRSGVIRIGGGDPSFGTLVRVQHPDEGIEALYAHLSGLAEGIANGVRVKAGQVIGYVGGSGREGPRTFDPHLHFEVNPIGPERFAGGRSDVAAFDPWAYLEGARNVTRTVSQTTSGMVGLGDTGGLVVVRSGKTGQPKPGAAARSGSVAPALVTTTTKAEASKVARDDTRLLGTFGGPTVSQVSAAGRRVGFVLAGFVIVGIGLLILAYSFRDQIGEAAGRAAQVGATTAKVAAV